MEICTLIAYNKMVYQIILLYILKHSWESSLKFSIKKSWNLKMYSI